MINHKTKAAPMTREKLTIKRKSPTFFMLELFTAKLLQTNEDVL
jgi:hypothetical protein